MGTQEEDGRPPTKGEAPGGAVPAHTWVPDFQPPGRTGTVRVSGIQLQQPGLTQGPTRLQLVFLAKPHKPGSPFVQFYSTLSEQVYLHRPRSSHCAYTTVSDHLSRQHSYPRRPREPGRRGPGSTEAVTSQRL